MTFSDFSDALILLVTEVRSTLRLHALPRLAVLTD
jgi:hypothetical protein